MNHKNRSYKILQNALNIRRQTAEDNVFLDIGIGTERPDNSLPSGGKVAATQLETGNEPEKSICAENTNTNNYYKEDFNIRKIQEKERQNNDKNEECIIQELELIQDIGAQGIIEKHTYIEPTNENSEEKRTTDWTTEENKIIEYENITKSGKVIIEFSVNTMNVDGDCIQENENICQDMVHYVSTQEMDVKENEKRTNTELTNIMNSEKIQAYYEVKYRTGETKITGNYQDRVIDTSNDHDANNFNAAFTTEEDEEIGNDEEWIPEKGDLETSSDDIEEENIDENEREETNEMNVEEEVDENTNDIPGPAKKKRSRNRKATPENWIRNRRKNNKRAGLPYLSSRKKFIPGKSMKYKDCSKCPKKCNEAFSEEQAGHIFEQFWKLGNEEDQRHFIGSLVSQEKKKSGRENSRRKRTNTYYLSKEGTKLLVCKGFFLSTLGITESMVYSIMKARNVNYFVEKSKRGKCVSANKIPLEARNFIKDHINSFPKVPSHYTRKDTNKEYLEKDLNLNIMYELYEQQCKHHRRKPEKFWYYRSVFKNEFNLSFHTPRKDMCDTCYVFEHSKPEEKETLQKDYDEHILRKTEARTMKNEAKERAEREECILIEFDLEAVCYTPATNAKALFYKSRLAVYNFTVLNVVDKKAICYMWHEGLANRGSNEVASCLWHFLQAEKINKEVVFFSDTCGGQNRNANVAAFCLHAVKYLDIPVINQMFFEPGHSQMEVDNIHAQIEKKKKNVDIFDPSGWYTLIRSACKKNPYTVYEVNQSDIKCFKTLKKEILKNKNTDTNGNDVNWLKITWLQYRKDDTAHIYFKYRKNEENFRKIQVVRRTQRSTQSKDAVLVEAYSRPIPISREKMQNLKELCNKKIIPTQYHHFYESLNSL